jgi:hypothetical protein
MRTAADKTGGRLCRCCEGTPLGEGNVYEDRGHPIRDRPAADTTSHPLDNTYAMILCPRLPLLQSEVKFLVDPDIPSIYALLRLRSDILVELIAVHPRPAQPAVDTAERDAELVLVGRRAKASRAPTCAP